MKPIHALAALLLFAAPAAAQPKVLVSGLVRPESVCVGPNGRIYATVIGELDKDGDGAVVLIENGKATPVVTGLDDPKGIVAFRQWLFVADKKRVLRIDVGGKGGATGKYDLFVPPNAFPVEPLFLNDVTADPESGMLYVSDSGDLKGSGGAVYRITPNGLVSFVANEKTLPGMHTPNGLAMDGASHLLLADYGTGLLYRIKLADGSSEKIAEGLGKPDGLAWDNFGRLYITDHPGGQVFVIPRPGEKPVVMARGFEGASDCCLDPTGKFLLVSDMKVGTITAVPITVPGAEVDTSPTGLQATVAFPDLKWDGWSQETDTGRPNPLRPIVLTHANDGTNRVFVATQHGVVHVFPNDQAAARTKVVLDIQERVKYSDNTNEEGFLGLCFHPRFKETGELFVFYTPKKENGVNVVSRFRLRKDDPTRADPASEEVILKYTKPYWNHDGGTICFGPDGYLYVFHGDGGSGNDLHDNGQNLGTLLGKILRIDVNAKSDGLAYSIPKDNPFVGVKGARPEIWAYGLRNVWRMSFDRKTGQLWAADVGQNLYEEINIIKKGGNYGWNRREGMHPFGARGLGVRKEFVEPIWEYHHDVGKSVTGGTVYRGKRLPELDGYYLYGDYVTTKLWALKYDEKLGRVVENRTIKDRAKPIFSFGEDEAGEVYFLTSTIDGKGIYWFTKE
jgi:glucose/arabinose dehydrogenase